MIPLTYMAFFSPCLLSWDVWSGRAEAQSVLFSAIIFLIQQCLAHSSCFVNTHDWNAWIWLETKFCHICSLTALISVPSIPALCPTALLYCAFFILSQLLSSPSEPSQVWSTPWEWNICVYVWVWIHTHTCMCASASVSPQVTFLSLSMGFDGISHLIHSFLC